MNDLRFSDLEIDALGAELSRYLDLQPAQMTEANNTELLRFLSKLKAIASHWLSVTEEKKLRSLITDVHKELDRQRIFFAGNGKQRAAERQT